VSKFPRTVDPAWIAFVKQNPCIACGMDGPSDAHHLRIGQGGSQRAGDHLAIPLCKVCHQTGTTFMEPSIHLAPVYFTARYGGELHLLDQFHMRAYTALCAAITEGLTA
jgi:hypothetical protein